MAITEALRLCNGSLPPAQAFAGHAAPQTTGRYIDDKRRLERQAVDAMSEVFSIHNDEVHMPDHSPRVRDLVARFEADSSQFGVLSHGEQIAVAAALARIDLLKQCGVSTLQQARDRLGEDWWSAAQKVSRERR